MTSIKETREAIDSRLDKLQAKAESVSAQVKLTVDEINERIDEHEKKLSDATVNLLNKLDAMVSGETMEKLERKVDRLEVQLALGAADTRDAINTKKSEILHAVAELNAELDAADAAIEREMAAEFDALIEDYVKGVITLNAELEAMEELYDLIET